ncbi:hypothetical protein AwDysgo_20950 [Bacteroidales bacterium]|nr:hypothetical protein AwDysgo_20950 [Bacteroidales bacterium]
MKLKIFKTAIPIDSLTRKYLPVDYTDAFACKLRNAKKLSADELQVALWTVMPRWVNALFKLRNALVRPFGLKTDTPEDIDEKLKNMISNQGESVGAMSLLAKSENETLLLLSDSHLDAYASIHIATDGDTQTVTTITLVKYHNRFGRIYFFFIKPFHKVVVKSGLKSTLKRLLK